MGALTATPIISRVSTLLQDVAHVRWSTPEILSYITDGIRELCIFKPDACAKTAVLNLEAGTKQSLPSDGVTLLDVICNMGTDGATRGFAPRIVGRDMLDAQNPSWHVGTASATVKHVAFDPQNQRAFYVQPPQPSTGRGSLEIVYAASPVEVTEGPTLPIDDVWMPVIVSYVLYRCYSKDAEYAGNASLAIAHYQAFSAHVGGKAASEKTSDINRNAQQMNPLARN